MNFLSKISEFLFGPSIPQEILDRVEKLKSINVVNINDPVTDGEMRDFYKLYLKKEKMDRRENWDTSDTLTYDEYRKKAYDWTGGTRYYCMMQKSSAFIGGMDGRPPTMISFVD